MCKTLRGITARIVELGLIVEFMLVKMSIIDLVCAVRHKNTTKKKDDDLVNKNSRNGRE